MFKWMDFIFTAAAGAVLVGVVVFPKTWPTAVDESHGEAVFHILDGRNSMKIILQNVLQLMEKLSNSLCCLKFRSIGRIKTLSVDIC